MNAEIENLWPADLSRTAISMPREILLQQAKYLSTLTRNILTGEVISTQGIISQTEKQVVVHEFKVKSPSIGGYQFSLIRVMHDFTIYPLTVYDILSETKSEVGSEREFKQALSVIFNSDLTRNAINSVMAQAV